MPVRNQPCPYLLLILLQPQATVPVLAENVSITPVAGVLR